MTDLHKAAQQALGAMEYNRLDVGKFNRINAACQALRAALAEPVEEPCPNCASLEAQNTELDRKLAEAERAEPVACPCGDRRVDQCPGKWEPGCDLGGNQRYARRAVQQPQTLDAAMQQPRAMAHAYESGYKAGAAAERETIIQAMPGGHSVDPQWVCDMIRARSNT